jgi:hypothetical protein
MLTIKVLLFQLYIGFVALADRFFNNLEDSINGDHAKGI